jgi:hypothetical protein
MMSGIVQDITGRSLKIIEFVAAFCQKTALGITSGMGGAGPSSSIAAFGPSSISEDRQDGRFCCHTYGRAGGNTHFHNI